MRMSYQRCRPCLRIPSAGKAVIVAMLLMAPALNACAASVAGGMTAREQSTTAISTARPAASPTPGLEATTATATPNSVRPTPSPDLPATVTAAAGLVTVTPTASPAPATPTTQPTNTPDAAPKGTTTALAGGTLRTDYPALGLSVLYPAGTFAATHLEEFAEDWSEAGRYVHAQLQESAPIAMTVELRADGAADPLGLGVRGYSEPQDGRMYQLYDASGDRGDREYITAHELGHMLIYPKLGWGANLMLKEGIAMYGSDEFLRRDQVVTVNDFAVAAYLQHRLTSAVALSAPSAGFHGRLIDRADYDLSGSFVSFLIDTYGMDKFDQVYPTANYSLVYGKPLQQLNQKWIDFLITSSERQPLTFDPARYFSFLDRVAGDYTRLYADAEQRQERLNQPAYQAVDAARLDVDRHDYATAEQELRAFDQAINAKG